MKLDKKEAIQQLDNFKKILSDIVDKNTIAITVFNQIMGRIEYNEDNILLAKNIQELKILTLTILIQNFGLIKENLLQFDLNSVVELFESKLNNSLLIANNDLRGLEKL